MKQTLLLLLALICINAKAATADPVMTMTTAKNLGETISFSLAANADNTLVQVDFGNGTLVDKTIGTSGASISGTLVGSKTVKIYGAGINVFSCMSLGLTSLDVTKNVVLESLICFTNQLTSLDVSKNTALTDLSCAANQLTSLNVANNIALTYLHCTSNQITSIDVTHNIALKRFECISNRLTSLDVTHNTALTMLYCANNQLTSLDVTKNTALTALDCSSISLTSLDVTKNKALEQLYCSFNQLTSLDVTLNVGLFALNCSSNQLISLDVTPNMFLSTLNCSSNQLTSLDVTPNVYLIHLDCSSNQLTSLDVTKNKNLSRLYCERNQLTYSTLPLSKPSTFSYAPQRSIAIAPSYAINIPIDLSSQLSFNGNTTNYKWKTQSGITLTAGTDYTISGGVTTFTTIPTGKVYCEMTNATFPDLSYTRVLTTKLTTIGAATAVEDANADVVDIYTQNQTVYLSLPEDALVQVYDITGHLVKSQNCNSGTNSFEVPQKGVFMVKVNMNNQSETRKIVVR